MGTISSTIKLIDNMSATLTKISGNVDALKKNLNKVGDEQSTFDNFSFSTFLENAKSAGDQVAAIGRNMSIALTLPLIKLGKSSYDAYKDHESAMTGVRKTVDATEEEFAQLESDLVNISQTTPSGFTEAAKVMEMAGQLGIPTEKLTDFTKAYIDLQESTNISGEQGAADLARFMNVTGEDITNTAKLGGVIVDLGNNFATTEQEILNMATRMGATAELAGFSATDILAFSTALSSVGIRAEAGGSAAGKLMKKMQLAAEVGGEVGDMLNSQDILLNSKTVNGVVVDTYLPKFENGLGFSSWMYTASKDYKSTVADTLGITADALQEYADNWLLFDQFSEVMGITGEEFLSGWKDDPAESLLSFFEGLGNLDPETGNSVLAQLAEMDITEIRLSNLVAAMAGNNELFDQALETARQQYDTETEINALAEEANKRYATTESQDQMLANQWENTLSNFGDNVKTAIEPAKEAVQSLLESFNGLSEVDQQKIVNLIGALTITGPALFLLGKTVSLVSSLATALTKISSLGGISGAMKGATQTATTTATTAGTSWLAQKLGGASQIASMLGSTTTGVYFDWFFNNTSLGRTLTGKQTFEDLKNDFADYTQSVEKNVETFGSDWANNPIVKFFQEGFETNGKNAMSLWDSIFGYETRTGTETERIQAMQSLLDLYQEYGDTWMQTPEYESVISSANEAFEGEYYLLDQYIDKMMEAGNIDWLTTPATDAATETVESTESIMNESAGASIGANFDAGIAGAISSGASSVISAAVAMVTEAIAAANAAAGIASPSKKTYWAGEMLIKGYTNAISKGESAVSKAMQNTISSAWDNISYFAGIENDQLVDDDAEIQISDSDIQKIRSLAEREAINEFTTAQVTVEFGGITNNVNKNTDLDEMLSYIEDQVTERLEAAAEGVYS